jgi:PAS domain S-box-containing protein
VKSDGPIIGANQKSNRLEAENAELRAQLTEARETLRAIRSGEVDAVVVEGPEGTQLYTLESAEAASNRFRGDILAQIEDVVIAVDNEERITFINAAAERLYGISYADAIGRQLSTLRTNQWADAAEEMAARLALEDRGSWRGENVQVKANGDTITVESTVNGLFDARGIRTGRLAVVRDITARKRIEAELQASAERLRFMAESMPQKIFTATPEGLVNYFNHQWNAFSGLAAQDLHPWEWRHFVDPKHLAETEQRWQQAVKSGDYFQLEHRFRRHDGGYHWHLTRAHAMRDPSGKVLLWVGSSTEIGDQKRNAEKLEALVADRTKDLRATNDQLEAFVYSIAHDLRGPLRTITGYSQVVVEEYSSRLPEEAQRLLKRIQASSEFLDKLLLDLLAFGRVGRAHFELATVEVKKAWEAAIFQCSTEIERRRARIEINGEFPKVIAHEATLGQCLANLLNNALKFARSEVPPHVILRIEPRGTTVRLWVEDNGIGIPTDQHERVFRVFERLNGAKYSGTGIGLSIVRKGMERMGGRVGIESEFGQGTRIWLELERAADQT